MEPCCIDGRLGCPSIEAPEFYSNDTWPLMNGHLSAISDITFNGRVNSLPGSRYGSEDGLSRKASCPFS